MSHFCLPTPTLKVFKNHGDVALRDVGSGYGGSGLPVGLDDLSDLFQPQGVHEAVLSCTGMAPCPSMSPGVSPLPGPWQGTSPALQTDTLNFGDFNRLS